MSEIKKYGVGYELLSIPYQGNYGIEKINYAKTVQNFIEEGATELVNIVKPVYAKEVALFRLMTEGIIMLVCGKSKQTWFSVDIDFRNTNWPVYVEIDMMPFEKYLVVKVPRE